MKKFFKLFVLMLLFILFYNNTVFANDEDNEDLQIEEVWQELEQVDANVIKEPILDSRAAVIFDRKSKTVIYEKNAYQKRAMASTTKIMTALLVLEIGNLDDVVEVSQKSANTGGSRLGLKKGDKITLRDLLYGLMLRSRK